MAKRLKSPTAKAVQQSFFEQNYIPVKPVSSAQDKKKKTFAGNETGENIPASELGLSGDDKEFGIYISSINNCAVKRDMEDSRLLPLLLKHYEHTLEHITRPDIVYDADRIKRFITMQRCNKGVCFYSRVVLGVSVSDRWFIKDFQKGNKLYWFDIPDHLNNARDLISAISNRVVYLTEAINKMKDEGL